MNSTEDKPVQENSGRSGNSYRRWSLLGLLLAALAVPVVAPMLFAQEGATKEFSKYVDAKGNISLPKNFETEFAHLGTIAVATKKDQPVDELHVTYTRPEDIKVFQKDGKFPDGAVLVKAGRGVTKEKLTTGQTSYAKNVKVWFVMVKDSEGRFKDNDLWGSGWGWALYEGDDRMTQVASDYRSECRRCHIPARKNDWVFTQCYPLLKKKE